MLPAIAAVFSVVACSTGVAACAPGEEATKPFTLAATDGVPDRFLVSLRQDIAGDQVRGMAERLTRKFNGKLGWVYQNAAKGFAVNMSVADARALADESLVTAIEQDVYGQLDETQTNAPHHLDRIDQRTRQTDGKYTIAGPTGRPTIYLLDTGLNTKHAEFGGRASVAQIFAPPDPELPAGSAYGADCVGHGTHVAGLAGGATRGVARTAGIVMIKVTRGCKNPLTRAGDVAMAIDYITANAAPRSVVSISIGLGNGVPNAGLITTAIQNATRAGIPIIVSAGNDAKSACEQTPARVPEAFTVAATSATSDARWSGSNFGNCVDIFAPGENIESASHTGNTGFVKKTGTSMSAPIVAGAAALLRARLSNRISPSELFSVLGAEATASVVTDSRTHVTGSRLLHVGGFFRSKGMAVPDTGVAATSRITVTNQGDATAPSRVIVNLTASHPTRGQLQIDLFSPLGTRTRLLSPSKSTDDSVRLVVPVSGVGVPANGVWTLSVVDTVRGTAGNVDSWSIQM